MARPPDSHIRRELGIGKQGKLPKVLPHVRLLPLLDYSLVNNTTIHTYPVDVRSGYLIYPYSNSGTRCSFMEKAIHFDRSISDCFLVIGVTFVPPYIFTHRFFSHYSLYMFNLPVWLIYCMFHDTLSRSNELTPDRIYSTSKSSPEHLIIIEMAHMHNIRSIQIVKSNPVPCVEAEPTRVNSNHTCNLSARHKHHFLVAVDVPH